MYHRSVIVKRAADAAPVSREKLSTMKTQELRVDQLKETSGFQRTTIWDHLCDLWTVVLYGLKPKNRHCINYGHNLPVVGWEQGRKPKCSDCGEAISNPEELRKSTPRF